MMFSMLRRTIKPIITSSRSSIHNASYVYLTKEMNEVKFSNSKLEKDNKKLKDMILVLDEEIGMLREEIDRLLIDKSMDENKIFNLQKQQFYNSLK